MGLESDLSDESASSKESDWASGLEEQHKSNKKLIQLEVRKNKFLQIAQDRKSLLKLKGLYPIQFTYKVVKFRFQPCKLYKNLSEKVKLYFSFHWHPHFKRWIFKREPLLGTNVLFYKILINRQIDDESIFEAIQTVYHGLKKWSKNYEQFRLKRNEMFKNGNLKYYELDSEDEVLLNEAEKKWVRNKRKAVWRRMVPPDRQGERYSELESSMNS